MKKFLILLTITCVSLGASAQQHLVVKGGGGISMLNGTSSYQYVPGIMTSFGLGYKHQIYKRVVLEGNINLENRKAVISPYQIINNVQYDLEIPSTWISMPLTIHWNFPFKKKELVPYRTGNYNTYWYVEGGPQLNYALAANVVIDPTLAADVDIEDAKAGGFDVGVVGGLGISFAFKNSLNRLCVGGRGYYGMLNYNKYEGAYKQTFLTAAGYISYDFTLSQKRHHRYRM